MNKANVIAAAIAASLGASAAASSEPSKEDLADVEKEVLGHLWSMAVSADEEGLKSLDEKSRVQLAALLRATADTVERAPQNIKGLVFIAGGNTEEAPTELESSCVITGSAPSIAAAFVQLLPICCSAMNEVEGELLSHALMGRMFKQ